MVSRGRPDIGGFNGISQGLKKIPPSRRTTTIDFPWPPGFCN
jgi:hypothetical protein